MKNIVLILLAVFASFNVYADFVATCNWQMASSDTVMLESPDGCAKNAVSDDINKIDFAKAEPQVCPDNYLQIGAVQGAVTWYQPAGIISTDVTRMAFEARRICIKE